MIDLNSNPLRISREFPTQIIEHKDIVDNKNFEFDPIFHKKYTRFLKGELKLYASRMKLSNIKEGFYKNIKNKKVYLVDDIPEEYEKLLMEHIKIGARPELYIYHNINKNDDEKFVCPDDIAVYRAYKKLGIKMVPVLIIGSADLTEESALKLNMFKISKKSHKTYITGIIQKEHKEVPTYMGNHSNKYTPESFFSKLTQKVKNAKEKLKLFHGNETLEFHYHHTLYYTLLRIEEILKGMHLLYSNNLFNEIASLLRSLYELMLTFYFDWIAPSQSYVYLKLSSLATRTEWEDICKNDLNNYKKNGLSEETIKRLYSAQIFGFNLASKVSEKATFFPFGQSFHKKFYSNISKIVHHDYSMTSRYIHTLTHGDDIIFNEDIQENIFLYTDIFTAAIITRITDDLGE